MASWPVYSERLIYTPGHVGWLLWTVPAASRAVLKHIGLVNYGQTGVYVQLAIAEGAFWGRAVPGPLNGLQESGMWVAYEGERVGIYAEAGTCAVSISGYLLSDVSGRRRSASADALAELERVERFASWPP